MADNGFPTGLAADYVVIGAGSAGSVVARRLLDRTDATVLVLEAGGPDDNPAIHDPLRMHELWHSAQDWDYFTPPQAHADNRRLHIPRGRVLGGSHALNATIYVRGNPADYDGWAAAGNPGWAWADVAPLFRRIERYADGAPDKGTDGLLDVLTGFTPDEVQQAIVAAAVQSGVPSNADHNGAQQDGVGPVQLTIRDGVRLTTAGAYLKPVLDSPRLALRTGVLARRLLTHHGRVRGVLCSIDGQLRTVVADVGVVLCAGAIESAALLLRSGIGPAEQSRAAGRSVTVDLPGVGRNLVDHWLAPVVFSAEPEIRHTPGLPHAQSQLFWRSEAGLAVPDVQPLHFSVPLYEPWMSGPANGFSLMAGLVRPASAGSVTVPDTDEVVIDPGVLAQPYDLTRLVRAVRLCREIGAQPALREWGAVERYPGLEVRDTNELADYVRRTVVTYHHASGTCAMGVGQQAVVDPALRVYGVDGLRVADASVMPTIPTGNTNAPTIMIAERVVDLLTAGS